MLLVDAEAGDHTGLVSREKQHEQVRRIGDCDLAEANGLVTDVTQAGDGFGEPDGGGSVRHGSRLTTLVGREESAGRNGIVPKYERRPVQEGVTAGTPRVG